MKKFLGNYSDSLLVEKQPSEDIWKLMRSFFFIRPNGEVIKVPAGILTDFASTYNVPLFPKSCDYDQAAVVHDYLYQGEFIPRSEADCIFREALEAIPLVSRWKIPVMYAAVRMFGGLTYKKHSIESIRCVRGLARVPDNEKRPLWKDGMLRFV